MRQFPSPHSGLAVKLCEGKPDLRSFDLDQALRLYCKVVCIMRWTVEKRYEHQHGAHASGFGSRALG